MWNLFWNRIVWRISTCPYLTELVFPAQKCYIQTSRWPFAMLTFFYPYHSITEITIINNCVPQYHSRNALSSLWIRVHHNLELHKFAETAVPIQWNSPSQKRRYTIHYLHQLKFHEIIHQLIPIVQFFQEHYINILKSEKKVNTDRPTKQISVEITFYSSSLWNCTWDHHCEHQITIMCKDTPVKCDSRGCGPWKIWVVIEDVASLSYSLYKTNVK